MIDTFRAIHCGQTFEGAEGAKALEAHMKSAHKGERFTWNRHDGRPYPWKAPAVPKDWESRLARVIADSPHAETDSPAFELGHYTNHAGFKGAVVSDVPPIGALPPHVASVLAATVARGEVWLVTLRDGGAFVQLATEVSKSATCASITIHEGKVRKVTGRGIDPSRPFYNYDSTITKVRAVFGPDATRESDAA